MIFFPINSKPFFAVIGDIIDSKKIKNRKDIQAKLILTLNKINQKYSSDIASNFMVTLGDEFQGLLHVGDNVIEIIEEIEQQMYPVKIRFGIGVGEILTDINIDLPLGADGSAYHNARKMIDDLKMFERKNMTSKPNTRIKIDNNDDIANLINVIFSLNTVIKLKWTKRQREIINVCLNHSKTQTDAAKKLGIDQSNVQKALERSNFYTYHEAINSITKLLTNIKGNNDV